MDIASALLAYLDTEDGAAESAGGISAYLHGCSVDERRAALEIIAAAALDDGQLSASEREMLEKRGDDSSAAQVERALSTVGALMPFAGDAARREFLAERAGKIASPSDRELVLGLCVQVLDDARADDVEHKVEVFAASLGLDESAIARVRATPGP